MSSQTKIAGSITGFVLLAIYSWVMTAGDGRPASWAWILLVAAVALLGMSARARAIDRGSHDS